MIFNLVYGDLRVNLKMQCNFVLRWPYLCLCILLIFMLQYVNIL